MDTLIGGRGGAVSECGVGALCPNRGSKLNHARHAPTVPAHETSHTLAKVKYPRDEARRFSDWKKLLPSILWGGWGDAQLTGNEAAAG